MAQPLPNSSDRVPANRLFSHTDLTPGEGPHVTAGPGHPNRELRDLNPSPALSVTTQVILGKFI